jgi:hypothetical protein
MAEAVDEIGAPIPFRRPRSVRRQWLAIEEQEFPAADQSADIERKGEVVVAYPARHRRQGLDVGEEVADVLDPNALIGAVGKRGKVVGTCRRRSPLERGDEVGFAPATDAVVCIW